MSLAYLLAFPLIPNLRLRNRKPFSLYKSCGAAGLPTLHDMALATKTLLSITDPTPPSKDEIRWAYGVVNYYKRS